MKLSVKLSTTAKAQDGWVTDMNYTYSSITRVLSIQHKGRVKTYSDINLFGIEACIKDFVNTWGYRHD